MILLIKKKKKGKKTKTTENVYVWRNRKLKGICSASFLFFL